MLVQGRGAQPENLAWLSRALLRFFLIRLDGRTRSNLVNDQPTGDLVSPPQSSFAHIFQDDELRSEIRRIIFDAFGKYFVIDPTKGGQLRIRLSDTPPVDEQSLNKEAREYHRNALYVRDASDGVQAYVGIVTVLMSGEYSTILIDEPEAFRALMLCRWRRSRMNTGASA